MKPDKEVSDGMWLERLRSGDEQAMRAIFDQHYRYLLSEAYKIVADEETCKDIVQEVFVELWKRKEDLEIHTSLRGYLKRSVFNRAINFVKNHKRFVFGNEEEAVEQAGAREEPSINSVDEMEGKEHALHAAIDSLPEKCRVVFNLSRFEELSHKQIAEQLGISTKTIENQITKALRIIREALIKHPNLSAIGIWMGYLYLWHRG